MNPTLDDLLEQLRQVHREMGNFASWEPHMFPEEADETWDKLQQEEADLLSAISQVSDPGRFLREMGNYHAEEELDY